MFKVFWVITDQITDITSYEFEKDWNGIYGFFEIFINKQELGYCPSTICDMEGDEEILYWINKLYDAKKAIDNNKKFSFLLLSMNLAELCFRKEKEGVIVSLLHRKTLYSKTKEIEWEEHIAYEEFCKTIDEAVCRFRKEIREKNSALLQLDALKFLL